MEKSRFKKSLAGLLCVALIFTSFSVAFADTGDVQDDSQMIQSILDKIDIEYGNKLAKDVSLMGTGELGFRTAGSPGETKAAAYIEKAMKDLGLSNVRKDAVPVDAWSFGKGTLTAKPSGGEAKTLTLSSYAGSVGTAASGITAEIVYAGGGTLEDYKDLDVTGKIVLMEFDMGTDYWVTMPAYQAELLGALAIIVGYNGPTYGTTQNGLNSFDVIARDTIPVMNASRADTAWLKEQIAKGPVEATLISDAKLDKNGKSGNVIGEIPGKQKDQYIIFAAHYDGYFHAYQDDILGVGVFMTVAKAVLESGYQPEHTLVFVAQCAEEYGVANSHYDWVRGSWYQVNHNTPGWVGNSTICLNFDTLRPDATNFMINVTPEYGEFLAKYALSLDLPKPWVEGYTVAGVNGPWSDDYNYIAAGIPGLMTGKGSTPWRTTDYHTDRDDYNVYNPEMFRFNAENYAAMMVTFDQLIMPPLNFESLMAGAVESLNSDLIKDAGLSDQALIAAAEKFGEASDAQYADIQKSNSLLVRLENAVKIGAADQEALTVFKNELSKNRKLGMEAYKVMEKDFMKLDADDVVAYGHEVAQYNLEAVAQAKAALESKDGAAALKALSGAQSAWAIPLFEKEVYTYWGIEAMNPDRKDLYWGTGKVLPIIDLYDVYHAISAKAEAGNTDFSDEIKTLDAKVTQATEAMRQTIKTEMEQIQKANGLIDQYTLKQVIEIGESALKEAYAKLPEGYDFSDVAENNWARSTVLGLMLEGVVQNDETFRPGDATTRGEVAEWMSRAFNLPTDAALPAFSDIDASHEKAPYVAAVCKAGLMQGVGNGQFMPDASLTRAQIATIAANLLALEASQTGSSAFSDVSLTSWYGGTVQSVYEAGIMIGIGQNTFEPNRMLTRAEACTILERLMVTK